jgi:tetratricopeptide (TPR) repeat protein
MTVKTQENSAVKGSMAYALDITERIPYAFDRAQAYSDLASRMLRDGYNEGALEVLEKAVDATDDIKDDALKAEVLAGLSNRIRELNQEMRADILLDVSVGLLALIEDPYPKVKALVAIADAYMSAKKYDAEHEILHKALNLASEIKSDTSKADSLSRIAEHYFSSDEITIALQVARSIELAFQRALTLAHVGSRLLDGSEDKQAKEIMSEAYSIIEEMSHPNAKADALSEMASIYLDIGHTDDAMKMLDEALYVSRSIADMFVISTTLAKISLVFAIAGNTEKAREVLARAEDFSESSEPEYLQTVFRALVASKYAMSGMYNVAADSLLRALDGAKQNSNQKVKFIIIKESIKSYKTLAGSKRTDRILRSFFDVSNTLTDSHLKTWTRAKVVVDYANYSSFFDAETEKVLKDLTS